MPNKSNNQDYQIRYDDVRNTFYFYSTIWTTTSWIYLNRNDLNKLRTIFEKYFEWETTAIQNEIKLEKEIPNSGITQSISWKISDSWYFSNRLVLTFKFFSQSITRHQLILFTNKVIDGYADFKIDGLYFNKEQIRALYNAISENNINQELEKIKANKEKESLFN